MPTYEYKCHRCEEKFTVMFVPMETRHIQWCPQCKGMCEKVMSATWHKNVWKKKSEIGA